MAKKYLTLFFGDDLDADFDTSMGLGIKVYDPDGKYNGLSESRYSCVDEPVPENIPQGSCFHHRISTRATLSVKILGPDYGKATYVIEVEMPEGELQERELYLCPVCGLSGPHFIFPDYEHLLASDGTITKKRRTEPKVWDRSETVCGTCGYTGEKRDFNVKNWKVAEDALIPSA